MSHESTKELSTNDAFYVEDSCHGEPDFLDQTLENKLEDSYVVLESQDHALDGLAVTLRVEVCENTVIPATIDKIARCMTSISKKSKIQNERKEEQEVSTSEVSRNLYKEFAVVGD